MESGEQGPAITLELAEPATSIVHVRGELRLGAAHRLRSVLRQAIHEDRCVVVDLRECAFIDSVSIGVLLTAQRHASIPAGGRSPLALVAGDAVVRTLELEGADLAAIPVRSTVEDALAAVRPPV